MPKLLKTSSDFKVNAMSADTDLEAVEALELCVLTGELEHIDSFLTEQELNLPRVAAMLRAIVNHMTQEKVLCMTCKKIVWASNKCIGRESRR
jgi:hypothetical protein